MDFGLYEMKIVRNNPSSVKSDPRLTRTNDLSPLGSDLSEVYCITFFTANTFCYGVSASKKNLNFTCPKAIDFKIC